MKFHFDASQPYQREAIDAVTDLFDGQPQNASLLSVPGRTALSGSEAQPALDLGLPQETGAIGNHLLLDNSTVLQNLQAVQDRNGLEVSAALSGSALDFDIEMETGTGKTYVYLRTLFELAERYNFTKFIILVPGIAVREGVVTSINLMREHLRQLYPARPFDAQVYSGKSPEAVLSFATATSVQIMVMTIDAIRGDAGTRIAHQARDKLNGLRPIDYLQATRPVVIIDEPQNMESTLSHSAIEELHPLCTLRYSATHQKQRNVVYRLDPIDAHRLGLVKQIILAEAVQKGVATAPWIRLVDVQRDPWQARLELICRKKDGSLAKRVVSVRPGQDLAQVTQNPAYDNHWRVSEISLSPPQIELTQHGILAVGEQIGGDDRTLYQEMIRETIREHLRKEAQLAPLGIKVLSLLFVDKVAHFLGDGSNNDDANGEFVRLFDRLLCEERDKSPRYRELLPHAPHELRRAYFAQMKARHKSTFVDSSGSSKKDDDAFELIMRDKARLLDPQEPARFIFSHSALREGWDNPNVFQICTLREMGGDTERRQTLGRGLRLPVDSQGRRVADRAVAQLTVIASEPYGDFARGLQQEYRAAGIGIGQLRPGAFARLALAAEDGSVSRAGFTTSQRIWHHLQQHGFIDAEGRVLGSFVPQQNGFTLALPPDLAQMSDDIIEILSRSRIEHFVKSQRRRTARILNKPLLQTPEFARFWQAISRRTRFEVSVDSAALCSNITRTLQDIPAIKPLRIDVTRTHLEMLREGTRASELGTRTETLSGSYDLPDILSALQADTALTRHTLVDILLASGRLDEFSANPNAFIQMMQRAIRSELAKLAIADVQYQPVDGSLYPLQTMLEDGEKEQDRFEDQLYRLKNPHKSDFDAIVCDSEVERRFAALLDAREDIQFFIKLPDKFRVPTPVGHYNPDWAIVKREDGADRLYLVRETKSSADTDRLRPTEQAKIAAARRHFAAIGIDYATSTPEEWGI